MLLGALLAAVSVAQAQQTTQSPQLCINIAGHTAPVLATAFSPDSALLFTAGLDKAVHVWRLPERPAARKEAAANAVLTGRLWAEERTIRWSIGRGQRGSIYAMAVSPKNSQLAIGGYGARGTLGDIALLDPAKAAVVKVLEEHRETVMSLAFSVSGNWLASMDHDGRLLLWPADGGKPRTLGAPDREVHGAAAAGAIAANLRLRPIAVAGDKWVAAPLYAGKANDAKRMTWRVQLYDIAAGQPANTLKTTHYGAITALACSPDARYVASADQGRQLFVWDVQTQTARRLQTSLPVVSLAFSPRGDVLAAGTACGEGNGASELQVWDIASGQLRYKRTLDEPVYACAISPDGQKLAYVGARGHDVLVDQLAVPDGRWRIAGGRQVTSVGITGKKGEYRILYSTLPEPLGTAKGRAFDPEKLEISPWEPPVPQASATCGEWQAAIDSKNNRLTVYSGGASVGSLDVDRQLQGIVHSFCWIPNAQGSPEAIAIGTNVQCGVYVYGLPQAGALPLLRYFRGHYDLVDALAVSADGRLLVSGSRDGTVRCWPLKDLHDRSAVRRRWGAELVEQNGAAVVAAIEECGPLYHKQVRPGDAITEILWLDGQTVRSEKRPQQILDRLAELPWHLQISFLTSREGAARPPFNLVGGWPELLGLYTTEGDWVAWTPGGYYACSAGGERLIGWQVNSEDLCHTPLFYSADKFGKTLYRPDVIRSLLKGGTIRATLQRQGQTPSHVNEIHPPTVKVVFSEQRQLERGTTRLHITAMAESKDERSLLAMRLLLDGRPYGQSRIYARGDAAGRKQREDWLVELTPGPHQIAIQAEGARGCSTDEIKVDCAQQVEIKPNLYCLSVGISNYPGQLRLHYGHSDAKSLAALLQRNAPGVFANVEAKTLMDGEATKGAIETGLQWLQKKATWKDVSIFFYAGHGINDRAGHFCLLPIGGSAEDSERTCVSDAVLKQFCQRTQGKVMILLDACRAASIKIDVNQLALELSRDDCGAIVMTSSTGYQESFEGAQWKGGAFTRALTDGLEGRADSFQTGYVSSPYDIASYVDHVVRNLTADRQTPICAAPRMPQFKITRATVH
jgi:WD40 repeat protein